MRYLDKVGIEKTPKEIASATELKINSVYVYLRRLYRRGFIENPHHGYYISKSNLVRFQTLGVGDGGFVPPRVHNVMLRGRYARCSSKKVDFDDVVSVTIKCRKTASFGRR